MTLTDSQPSAFSLAATLAWLAHERPLTIGAQGVEQRSRLAPLVIHDTDNHLPESMAAIHRRRVEILEAAGVPIELPAVLPAGRLALVINDFNLVDGAAFEPSKGLIDYSNIPLCDLWIEWYPRVLIPDGRPTEALLWWVPEEFAALAQRGFNINPEESIGWAEDLSPGTFALPTR